jgi:hypothetical protein
VSRECGGKELDEREPLGYSLKTEIRKRKKIFLSIFSPFRKFRGYENY